jgi:hypothetical protein
MCLRGIRESDWPRDRIAANTAKLPELLKRPQYQKATTIERPGRRH